MFEHTLCVKLESLPKKLQYYVQGKNEVYNDQFQLVELYIDFKGDPEIIELKRWLLSHGQIGNSELIVRMY